MASLTIDDLMRAYYLGVLGYTPATGNTQSLDNLAAQFFALGPPAPAAMQYATGVYYFGPHATASTQIFGANGECRYTPLYFDKPITISEYAIEITTAGAANSLARLGIYAMKADGLVGTLVDDGGTVLTDTTGARGITGRSVRITPGFYYLAAAQQGAVGVQATFRSVAQGLGNFPFMNTASATPVAVNVAQNTLITAAGVTGAFASNPAVTIPTTNPNYPRVQFKISSIP